MHFSLFTSRRCVPSDKLRGSCGNYDTRGRRTFVQGGPTTRSLVGDVILLPSSPSAHRCRKTQPALARAWLQPVLRVSRGGAIITAGPLTSVFITQRHNGRGRLNVSFSSAKNHSSLTCGREQTKPRRSLMDVMHHAEAY